MSINNAIDMDSDLPEYRENRASWLGKLQWSEQIELLKSRGEMVAIAGPQSLEVFYVSATDEGETNFKSLAKFNIGTSTLAMSWSSSSFSPTFHQESTQWQYKVELVIATKNGTVRILSSSTDGNRDELLSTNEGRINSLAWSEAEGSDNLIAVAYEDGRLRIFDDSSQDEDQSPASITFFFPNPLISTSFHRSIASLILVSDAKGITRLISYEESKDSNSIKTLVTLKDPKSLSRTSSLGQRSKNVTEWKRSDSNLLASFNDGHWKVWDLRRLSGGSPCSSARIYEKGTTGGLRWSTDPSLLAVFVTSTSPNPSQSISTSLSFSHPISILDSAFPDSPRRISRSSLLGYASGSEIKGPNIRDLDWLDTSSILNPLSPLKDQDVLMVAMGKEIVLISATSARAD